jgi:hypothetical protein
MDPYKRSSTIEVMTADETVVGGDRFATDRDGYAEMRRYAGQWPDRVSAIEGCAGIGKHMRSDSGPTARRSSPCRRAVGSSTGVRHRAGP